MPGGCKNRYTSTRGDRQGEVKEEVRRKSKEKGERKKWKRVSEFTMEKTVIKVGRRSKEMKNK